MAVAILGIAFGVTIATIGPALRRIDASLTERSATLYGQSLLARVGADLPLVDGVMTGQDRDLYWTIRIAPWRGTEQETPAAIRATFIPHMVEVSVSWRGIRDTETIRLMTLRLGTER